jgi:hypothetical protein
MDRLKRVVTYLKQHVVICKFAVDLTKNTNPGKWIHSLDEKLRINIELFKDVGGGFFYLKPSPTERREKLLEMNPCKLHAGMLLVQPWISASTLINRGISLHQYGYI